MIEGDLRAIHSDLQSGFLDADSAKAALQDARRKGLSLPNSEKTRVLPLIQAIDSSIRAALSGSSIPPLPTIPPAPVSTTTAGATFNPSEMYLSPAERAMPIEQRAKNRIEQVWTQITKSDNSTKNTVNQELLYRPLKDSINDAGLMVLVDRFFPSEKDAWDAKINLWNGFASAAKTDIMLQGGWDNAEAARQSVMGHIGFEEVREFARMPKYKEAVQALDSIYSRPWRFAGGIVHNYAKDGGPTKAKQDAGVPKISVLLKHLLSKKGISMSDSDLFAVELAGIIGEVRLKYHSKYHGGYTKSPDGAFDVSEIFVHSPQDAMSYKIRAYAKIYPEHRLLFQILRFPKKSRFYSEEATRESSRDRKVHGFDAEFIFEPIPPGFKKSDPSLHGYYGYGNENLKEAIEVRTFLDQQFTIDEAPLKPVRMGEDLVLIPYYWDLIITDDFGPITYREYSNAIIKWKQFLAKAQTPPEIRIFSDIDDAMTGLIAALSPVKALLGVMPEGTPHGERFREVLKQILTRYLKYIYDEYEKKARYGITQRIGNPMTKRGFFFKTMKKQIKQINTLDKSIGKHLTELMDEYSKRKYFDTYNFFSAIGGDPMPFTDIGEKRRRQDLLNLYLKPPTKEERQADGEKH